MNKVINIFRKDNIIVITKNEKCNFKDFENQEIYFNNSTAKYYILDFESDGVWFECIHIDIKNNFYIFIEIEL